jgi:hypothetical protein
MKNSTLIPHPSSLVTNSALSTQDSALFPIPALTVSYFGTITAYITEAKSVIGALAALASFIASCYAIAIAQKNLKRLNRDQDPPPVPTPSSKSPKRGAIP